MSATLISAIRDFSGLCKVLQSTRSSDLQQMMELEKQIQDQLGQYKMTSMINISARVSAVKQINHPPLIHSNSVAIPAVRNSGHHRKLDRSVSEPVAQQQQPRPIQTNSSRYKTELCRPFEENGTCKYGDKCQFAHGVADLRSLARHPKYKTELCRTFHTTGFCPYGPRCHFIHNDIKNHPMNQSHHPSRHLSASDFEMGSFSVGSTGELSPNSSSISGSPTSSSGFYSDDIVPHGFSSPVPPQTAPPFVSNAGFFGQDFHQPFTNAPSQSPPRQVQEATQFDSSNATSQGSPRQAQETLHYDVGTIGLLSASVDNLNLRDNSGPMYDINSNLRLPIFSKFGVFDTA